MNIVDLQVNHMRSAIGIDGKNIKITWNICEANKQKCFQVSVTDSKNRMLHNSNRIFGAQTCYDLPIDIEYRTKANIDVRSWDENEEEAAASMKVITGISQGDWKAVWINPEEETPDIETRRGAYLKKQFYVDADMVGKTAYIYATCHGLMDIYINGNIACENKLMPGTQQYDQRLMVETMDVSALIKPGVNEIIVSLGDGWYRGSMANDRHKNVYGSDIALLLQMEIDGIVIEKTDETWLATNNGPIGKNDFMWGEEYDARKEVLTGWHPVKVEDFGYSNLICRDTVPVTAHETFHAKYIETPDGSRVLDFGQNLVGYVQFHVNAKAGMKIKLSHGETLDKDGNFTIANFQNPRTPCTQDIYYTCKDGTNEYHPTKTYMGFRYVKVEADMDIPEDVFTAVAIYSDMRQTGYFECGIEEVNQLFSNALWSMKGNFVDVPTDCPTREKSGYSGDIQAYIDTAMYLMDCYAVCAKWVREQAAGQYEDGVVPQIAPKPTEPGVKQALMGVLELDGGIGWSDSFEILPYKMWKRYGETALIKENYEALKAWTEHEIRRAKNTRPVNEDKLPAEHREYMIDTEFMWGEWMEPGQDNDYVGRMVTEGDPEVGTAFFYTNLKYMEEFAAILGKKEDVERYAMLAQKAKEAYRAVYLKDGRIKESSRQCRFVRPIAHDLLEKDEKYTAAKDLASLIEKNHNHLNTGFLSTHDLPQALSDYGQEKVAYDLLLQEEMPGWLYAVKEGCTTIPERWDIYDENGNPHDSFNHYSYGAIAGWLIDSVCGIRVRDGKITLQPKPDQRLGFANGSYDSPMGKIVSEWKYDGDHIHYHFEIPANVKAEIILNHQSPFTLETGMYDFAV